ncbi:hypothetical protein ACTFIR_003936 [Dictyostelium discoideum]
MRLSNINFERDHCTFKFQTGTMHQIPNWHNAQNCEGRNSSNSKSNSGSNDKSKNFNGSPSNVASGSNNITRLLNDHFTKSDDLPKQKTCTLASIEGMRREQTHSDLTELKLYPTLPQLPVETLGYSGGWFVIHL